MGDGRSWRSQQRRIVAGTLIFVILVGLSLGWLLRRPWVTPRQDQDTRPNLPLFVAIGSAPGNVKLRNAARQGWLRWASETEVMCFFFTDLEVDAETDRALQDEHRSHGDIVRQPLPGGYTAFGRRALYQLRYAVDHYNFTHFLRIDDDSFLCLHRLLYELRLRPTQRFFWAKFWCKAGRNRADENFMLMSQDVVRFVLRGVEETSLLPFDESVTFAWNFGLWTWFLNLTVLDDIDRIDAQQQGYLTDYMHGETIESNSENATRAAQFCHRYIYAHHVNAQISTQTFELTNSRISTLYSVPPLRSNKVTCSRSQLSYIPGRHSKTLPSIIVSAAESEE